MYLSSIQKASLVGPGMFGHQKSMERKLEVGFFLVDDPLFSNQVSIFHDNSGPCLTIFRLHRVTAVPVRRNGISSSH